MPVGENEIHPDPKSLRLGSSYDVMHLNSSAESVRASFIVEPCEKTGFATTTVLLITPISPVQAATTILFHGTDLKPCDILDYEKASFSRAFRRRSIV